MKRRISLHAILAFILFISFGSLKAQYLTNDSAAEAAVKAGVPNTGRLWGYAFGDYYFKAHADSLGRGGSNQYTGVKANSSAFQFRRIYIGYDYNITKNLAAEILLAAEDDFAGGDLTQGGKFTPYVKYANIRWRNFLFKGNDLVVGLAPTPAFPYLTESVWNYRSIERTASDIRRTPSFDFGASLQGRWFSPDKKNSWGYNLMVGNGTSAKPETDQFKWFYGDVFYRNHAFIVDLYADYERLGWTSVPSTHHERNMVKLYVAYSTPALTIGVESLFNHGGNDVIGLNGAIKDTTDAMARTISTYIHGNIVKGKLRFFARVDFYNPDTKYDNTTYTKYTGLTSNYEPNNKETFVTAGLDFLPGKNVHFMPNIWYNRYVGQEANLVGAAAHDYDLVYRMTFYFVFGRLFTNPTYSYTAP